MNNHTPVTPSALQISAIAVRQDSEGRYCLNDLHKAAGNQKKHQPSDWLRTQQAKELINEINIPGIPGIDENEGVGIPTSVDSLIPLIRAIETKQGIGTFAVKELVYAYAMWISASFSLKVIRAYDALQTQPPQPLPKPHLIRTKLLVSIEGDKVRQVAVPFGCCIVDPDDAVSINTFVDEYVSDKLIGELLVSISQRLARHYQAAVAK